MSENIESSNSDNSFEKLKQQAKEDSIKRQKNIFLMIQEMGIRDQLAQKLEDGGVFLAGLSTLKEIDILYLIGACSGEERSKYLYYEKKYSLKRGDCFEGVHIYDQKTGQELDVSDVKITASMRLEDISYEDVSSFAENFGDSFNISYENLLLAKEIKRTAFLFEMLKTNIHALKIPYEDGLPYSNWYDKSNYENSENKILQNLICILNTLNIEDEKAKAFLNLMVYLRLFSHAADLSFRADRKETDIIDSFRMKYSAEFFDHLIPTKFNFSSDERFILLYFAIQNIKDAIKKYPDQDVSKLVLNWLEQGVQKFEEHIPDHFKNLEVELRSDILNDSFYLKGKKERREQPEEEKSNEMFQSVSFDSLYDQVFSKIDEEIVAHDEAQQEVWKSEMRLVPKPFHGIYKLTQLSDVYSFYALGIIDEKELSLLTQKIREDFSKNAFKVLEEWFNENASSAKLTDSAIEEGFDALYEAKKDNLFNPQMLVTLLEKIGWSADKINQLSPKTKEALTSLLKEDFDKNIPLALKFKKEIFNLVHNFREISSFLMDKMIGVNDFSLDLNLPLEKLSDVNNPDLTKINRIMLCGDILDEVKGVVPNRRINEIAHQKIQNLVAGYYLLTLQKILNLSDSEQNPEQAKRMQELFNAYNQFNVPVCVLETEQEDLAFLRDVIKLNLKSFSNSKASQNYYLDWFDYVMDFSNSEKERLKKNQIAIPQYRRNPHLNDSMSFSEQRLFLKDMANHYFSENDQKANHYDKRVAFGVCTDIDLLYAMGVLSPFEYDKMGQKSVELVNKKNRNVSFFEVWSALQEEQPALKLPFLKDVVDVMEQIQSAGRLLDYSYQYEGLSYSGLNYQSQTPQVVLFDFKKNPLKAEGRLMDTLLMMMKDLKEYNLEESNAMRQILNSYWKESTQRLNDLAMKVEKKYPEMAKRILEQREIFGIRPIERKETIANRFRYYPKLFALMRKTIEKEHKCGGGLIKMQNFFENEIKGFVSFYAKRAPILKEFLPQLKERE